MLEEYNKIPNNIKDLINIPGISQKVSSSDKKILLGAITYTSKN